MGVGKADYGRIAETYDRARVLHRASLHLWLGMLAAEGQLGPGVRVLDLGCGTGRFALPLAHQIGCRVVGLDRSREMLARAREKDPEGRISWLCADAAQVPLAEAEFGAVFMSHLLHHVDDPASVLREAFRVLVPAGRVLIRYGAMSQIREDPEHVFFPEAAALDEVRTPEVEQVEAWLREAGFERVRSREVCQQTYASPEDRLAAARLKAGSVLTLISDEAYREGLTRLEAYVADHPHDEWLLRDRMTLTWGLK
mgnify:CR=1 FL=1